MFSSTSQGKIMRLNEILTEGRDAPLYHFASPEKIKHLADYDELVGDW